MSIKTLYLRGLAKVSFIYHNKRTLLFILSIIMLILTLAVFLLFIYPLHIADSEILPDRPLVIAWEYVYNHTDTSSIEAMSPLQIVSPTWFHISSADGTIENLACENYLQWAWNRGYKVWGLVSNSFDPDITAVILSDPVLRRSIVEELINLSLEYKLDGLNIDFENFHSDYRDHFSSFIYELAELCHEHNLTLSVDVTIISDTEYWSLCYDLATLSEAADYIIVMAYDEHWKGSPVPGSVSSLPWVEKGIVAMLLEVPAEKLILGVPFYTRLWEIDDSGETLRVIGSNSYSMMRAEQIIADNKAMVTWDEQTKQHLAYFYRDDHLFKMWLEDIASMQYRLKLVDSYNLAGIAAWRRGLEKPEIWDLIEDHWK